MKTFELGGLAAKDKGEYVLGMRDLDTHACYMIYGVLAPGEEKRRICPGSGHEEIILAATGDLEVTGELEGTLRQGSAFHIAGETICFLANRGQAPAVYIAAGGHSEGGH